MSKKIYSFIIFFLALTTNLLLATQPTTASALSTQTPQQRAQKTIRSLASIKNAIEAELLESETGLWPRNDDLFKQAAELIIECYAQKHENPSLVQRTHLALLEDFVVALQLLKTHQLSRRTPELKKLTQKTFQQISSATKTAPDQNTDDLNYEKTIKKAVFFIKNNFLPQEPILPRQETLVEKIQKKARSAYAYIAEVVEENPFTSGVVITIAIIGTAYVIKCKYFPKESPEKGKPEPKKPVKLDTNASVESISAPSQKDGKSCGYHAAKNSHAFAKTVAAKKKELGRPLTTDELISLVKSMQWPTREEVQGITPSSKGETPADCPDKATFLRQEQTRIDSLTRELSDLGVDEKKLEQIRTIQKAPNKRSTEQQADIIKSVFGNTKPEKLDDILAKAQAINKIEILINGGGWLEGEGVSKFIQFLQTQDPQKPPLVYQDTDTDNLFHWDLYEVSAEYEGIPSVENRMKEALRIKEKVLAATKDNPATAAKLQDILKTLKNTKTGEYDQATLTTKILGELTLADIFLIKELLPNPAIGTDGKPIGFRNAPAFFRFLQSFHDGLPLILAWRQPGHWTCNIVIPEKTDGTTKARGFVVDSYGTSKPPEFTTFLNFLVKQKPLSQEETNILKVVFSS